MKTYSWMYLQLISLVVSPFLLPPGMALADVEYVLICPDANSGEDPMQQNLKTGMISKITDPTARAIARKVCANMDAIGGVGGPFCGDGTVNGDEQCDGADLGGLSCADFDFDGGSLGCTSECAVDVSGCTGPVATCDDGVMNQDETGIDCGGTICDACADGETCQVDTDCLSNVCSVNGICVPFAQCGLACDGLDLDLCKEGLWECATGQLVCSDVSGDNMEICDGADNDCDGAIDEDIPPQPGSSECLIRQCIDGSISDVPVANGTLCRDGTFEGECVDGTCEVDPCQMNPNDPSCNEP